MSLGPSVPPHNRGAELDLLVRGNSAIPAAADMIVELVESDCADDGDGSRTESDHARRAQAAIYGYLCGKRNSKTWRRTQ